MDAAWIVPVTALTLFAPAPPAERTKEGRLGKEVAALERKLHGEWRGGACDGDLVFHAGGRYEHQRHGPGGADSAGTWEVRWDALPPTLILDCKTSTDPDCVRKQEVKVIVLDGEALSVQHPRASPTRYRRVKK